MHVETPKHPCHHFKTREKQTSSFNTLPLGCFKKNIGKNPQIIHFNMVFHYKPYILGVKSPYCFGNIHYICDFSSLGMLDLCNQHNPQENKMKAYTWNVSRPSIFFNWQRFNWMMGTPNLYIGKCLEITTKHPSIHRFKTWLALGLLHS